MARDQRDLKVITVRFAEPDQSRTERVAGVQDRAYAARARRWRHDEPHKKFPLDGKGSSG